jgi:hypothetical protein
VTSPYSILASSTLEAHGLFLCWTLTIVTSMFAGVICAWFARAEIHAFMNPLLLSYIFLPWRTCGNFCTLDRQAVMEHRKRGWRVKERSPYEVQISSALASSDLAPSPAMHTQTPLRTLLSVLRYNWAKSRHSVKILVLSPSWLSGTVGWYAAVSLPRIQSAEVKRNHEID